MFRFLAAAMSACCGLTPVVALAEPVSEVAQAHCITPLHLGTELGFGLERAPASMETKLLNGKIARLYRTGDPQVLLVAHESGQTCEVMALGVDIEAFGGALEAWEVDDVLFSASSDSKIDAGAPSGGYYVVPRAEGGFIQAFVTIRPDAKFIGVTVGRVTESAMAREVLGLE